MTGIFRGLLTVLFLVGFTFTANAFRCQVCGKDGYGEIFVATDKITGEKEYVCGDCVKLPRCYLCGLPVKAGGTTLPDGRIICERDAKTVVLDANEAQRTCEQVRGDLDRLFVRFTEFPANVDIEVIDRIDLYSVVDTAGNTFESPDIMGLHQTAEVNGQARHRIRLMTGLPRARLKEVCAHELSHAWVGENVPKERHARLDRDAEEGFCEMVGYLLIDSQNEEAEKKFLLANLYTRGQVQLFLEAEGRFGFDPVLEWMKYGETTRLHEGHLEEIRNVNLPSPSANNFRPARPNDTKVNLVNSAVPAPAPKTFASVMLQEVLWSKPPVAIINGHSFFVNDWGKVNVGTTNVTIQCLSIQTNSVRIRDVRSGQEKDLPAPHH